MERKDVVVIGAGPAGSTAARKVAEGGHDVLLLEKDRFAGETVVCGGGLVGSFAEDLDLPEGVVEKYINDWLIHLPDKTYYVENQPGLSFQRCKFDRFLSEEAARKGADLRLRSLATDVGRNSDGLIVKVKDRASSRDYEVKSRLVIFADGPHTMAQRFGLGFPRAQSDITVHAAIYELESKDNPLNCFEFFFDENVAPWGYGWVFPKRDVLNVGVGCLISKMKGNVTEYLNYFVDKYGLVSQSLRTLKKVRFAAAIIPIAHASRIVADNILVAGDAAGMVDPIWGGGIGPALRGASIAGQVASRALDEDRFDADFVSQYDKAWKRTPDYGYLRRAHLAHKLFLRYSKLSKKAFLNFMALAMWRGKIRELKLAPHDLLSKGVKGVSNLASCRGNLCKPDDPSRRRNVSDFRHGKL